MDSMEMNGDADLNGDAGVRKGSTGARTRGRKNSESRLASSLQIKSLLFNRPGLVTGKSEAF